MIPEINDLSFEEFELMKGQADRGGRPKSGANQVFLRSLRPLEPTIVSLENRSFTSARKAIYLAWRGRGENDKIPTRSRMRDEKGGYITMLRVVDKLWIVWYPEGSD